MFKLSASVALAMSAFVVAAWAQENPAEIVLARQKAMDDLWPKHFQGLIQAGRAPTLDAARIEASARSAADAVKAAAKLFPPGTGRDVVPKTRAKPDVWTNRVESDRNLTTLASETDKIAEVAKGGNADAIRAQITKAAQACGACHSGKVKEGGTFRYEDNT